MSVAANLETRKNQKILSKSGGRCWYCGTKLYPVNFTVDHVVPRTEGGRGNIDNLVPCCKSCNSRKSNRPLEHMRTIMGRRDGWIAFTDQQKEWLRANYGIDVDADWEGLDYVFWFEKQGYDL